MSNVKIHLSIGLNATQEPDRPAALSHGQSTRFHQCQAVKIQKHRWQTTRCCMWRNAFHGRSLFMYENQIQTEQLLQLWPWQTTDTISRREWNFLRLTMKCVHVKRLRDRGQSNWFCQNFSSYTARLTRWIITTGWNRLTKSAVIEVNGYEAAFLSLSQQRAGLVNE